MPITVHTEEVIQETEAFPLRFYKSDHRYVACPYEITRDNLTLKFLKDQPRVAHFEVKSIDFSQFSDGGDFKRQFLYSRFGEKHIFTASGYLFTDPVNVYSWKAKKYPKDIIESEREGIELLSKIELVNVTGDKEGVTGGLDNAVQEHLKRTASLEVDFITLEDAMRVYDAMRNHVPNS